ncbi:MAG: UbiA family prenyltransferase [Nannocystaceae bacterium]
MRRALLRLAYANVLISLHAAGFACAALVLSGEALSLPAIALPAAAMYVVYTFDKVARFDPQDDTNDPQRSAFIRRWRAPLLVSGGITALVAGGVALGCGGLVVLLFGLPLIAGVLYALPLRPAGARYRRIKDVTGLKSLYVAAVWVATAGLLPLALVGAPLEASTGLVTIGAWILARMLINTIYFDMGDLEGDRASGTRTIPVVFGFAWTRRLLLVLNGVAALLLTAGAALGVLPPAAHVVNLVTIYAFVYLGLADGRRDLGFLCDVIVDGEGSVLGGLSLIGLWLAGLGL